MTENLGDSWVCVRMEASVEGWSWSCVWLDVANRQNGTRYSTWQRYRKTNANRKILYCSWKCVHIRVHSCCCVACVHMVLRRRRKLLISFLFVWGVALFTTNVSKHITHICVCVYIYIYVHTCIYVYIRICIYVYVYTYVYVYVYVYTCKYTLSVDSWWLQGGTCFVYMSYVCNCSVLYAFNVFVCCNTMFCVSHL